MPPLQPSPSPLPASVDELAVPRSLLAKQRIAELVDLQKLEALLHRSNLMRILQWVSQLTPSRALPAIDVFDVKCRHLKPHPDSPLHNSAGNTQSISVELALRFYGMGSPETEAQTQAALRTLQEIRAVVWLDLQNGSPFIDEIMDEGDQQQVLAVLQHFVADHQRASGGVDTLPLKIFSRDLSNDEAAQLFRSTPCFVLKTLLLTPTAQALGVSLLKALDWYGGAGETTSPVLLAQLVWKALKRWHDRAKPSIQGYIAAFDFNPAALMGRTYGAIRSDFQKHVQDYGLAPCHHFADLLATILTPADFTVRDVPDDLVYGSATWVNFLHGVNLADVISPEASRRMSFLQLLAFPAQIGIQTSVPDTATADEKKTASDIAILFVATRQTPMLVWAANAGIVSTKALHNPSIHEVEVAATALDAYQENILAAVASLSAPVPDRIAMATQKINELNVPPDLPVWNTEQRGATLLEAYASGEKPLSTWSPRVKDIDAGMMRAAWPGEQPYSRYAQQYRQLLPLDFEQVFATYLQKAEAGYKTLIQNLLVNLAQEDRIRIENGEVQLYTLRQHVGRDTVEDDIGKQAWRGRQGFILEARYLGKKRYYEVFPKQMKVVRRREFESASFVVGRQSKSGVIAAFGTGALSQIPFTTAMPFDWAAYNTGCEPAPGVTSALVIEHLGLAWSVPSNANQHRQQAWLPQRIREIAERVTDDLFYVDKQTLRQAARGVTDLEKENPAMPIIKAFVPFWGTIEDLLSGDRERIDGASFSALGDLTSFIPILKFMGGTARLVARGGKIVAMLPKMAPHAKTLLVSLAQELVPNPMGLMQTAGHTLQWSGKKTLKQLSEGLSQLRKTTNKLTGRGASYDLVTADPHSWKPLSAGDVLRTVDDVNNVPVRTVSDGSVYRVDPVFGTPYGPRLIAADSLQPWRSAYTVDERIPNRNGLYEIEHDTYLPILHDATQGHALYQVRRNTESRLELVKPGHVSDFHAPLIKPNDDGSFSALQTGQLSGGGAQSSCLRSSRAPFPAVTAPAPARLPLPARRVNGDRVIALPMDDVDVRQLRQGSLVLLGPAGNRRAQRVYTIKRGEVVHDVEYDVSEKAWKYKHSDEYVWRTEPGQWTSGPLEGLRAATPLPGENVNRIKVPRFPQLDAALERPIPKRIHFIWIGDPMPPARISNIIESAKCAPTYSVIVHVDANNRETQLALQSALQSTRNIRVINMTQEPFFHALEATQAYTFFRKGNGKNFAAASDVVRYPLVNEYGGLYMDSDDCIRTVWPGAADIMAAPDDVLTNRPLLGQGLEGYNNSHFASQPNNPVLNKISVELKSRFHAVQSTLSNRPYGDKIKNAVGDTVHIASPEMRAYEYKILETTGPILLNTVIKRERPDVFLISQKVLEYRESGLYQSPAQRELLDGYIERYEPFSQGPFAINTGRMHSMLQTR